MPKGKAKKAAVVEAPPPPVKEVKGSKAVAKKVPKVVENEQRGKKIVEKRVRPKKKDYNSYGIFLYKVLKQIHPDTGISSKAM